MEIVTAFDMNIILDWSMRLLSGVLVLGAGWIIGKYTKETIGKIKALDATIASFLGGFAKYAIFIFSGVIVLGQFGVQTASLIAVLGAAGLAIGLALQGTLSNIAAGVMLLILRPFNVGDYIEFGENGGTVMSLGLFGTELATADNVYIFAPNGTIWGSNLYNYSRNTQRRMDIIFGISYGEDIGKAIKTVQTILDSDKRLVTTDGKKPQVMMDNMGDFSLNFIARFWCKSKEYWEVKWDLTRSIKEALDKEGIVIPTPARALIHEEKNANISRNSKNKSSK
jgi:small conductance mechanosensitive channel